MTVILDILKGVNVAVHAEKSLGKSLPSQAIFTVKIGAIVLMVSPTVALIKDEIDDLLILLLSCSISDDVLFLIQKKNNQHYCTNL